MYLRVLQLLEQTVDRGCAAVRAVRDRDPRSMIDDRGPFARRVLKLSPAADDVLGKR